jgi:uncharacterized membrane protein
MARILLVGESWIVQTTHIKGVDHFTATAYEEGTRWLVSALAAGGHDVVHLPSHEAPARFPGADDLRRYDAVLLSDIGADSILLHPDTLGSSRRTEDRLEALARCVEAGAGLAMIGGWMSFSGYEGRARYGRTALARVLPVALEHGDDRVETPAGVTPVAAGPEHPVLDGLGSEWPWFLGYNRLRERDGGAVLLRCGEDPFLAVAEVGAGRTLAFASDCAPHWASPSFLEWDHHDRFWQQAIAWLCGGR